MIGLHNQTPFEIEKAKKNSVYWKVVEQRMTNVDKFFLASATPKKLVDAHSVNK